MDRLLVIALKFVGMERDSSYNVMMVILEMEMVAMMFARLKSNITAKVVLQLNLALVLNLYQIALIFLQQEQSTSSVELSKVSDSATSQHNLQLTNVHYVPNYYG